MAWDVLCNYLDLEFCFRKEEAAQQVHKLLISAVARVDYCNHSRVIAPSQNGGALPRLTPNYGSEYNGDYGYRVVSWVDWDDTVGTSNVNFDKFCTWAQLKDLLDDILDFDIR